MCSDPERGDEFGRKPFRRVGSGEGPRNVGRRGPWSLPARGGAATGETAPCHQTLSWPPPLWPAGVALRLALGRPRRVRLVSLTAPSSRQRDALNKRSRASDLADALAPTARFTAIDQSQGGAAKVARSLDATDRLCPCPLLGQSPTPQPNILTMR